MSFLTLKVITPENKIFEESEIESISFPTQEGEITVLPNHIPLLSQTMTGEVVIRKKGKDTSLVITEGFLKIDKSGNCLVLADYAIRSEDIEELKVTEAKKKAEESMKEKTSQKDFAIAEAELRRTLMELKVSQRRKQNTPRG
jgi:F-type H+-transporting ATPase subunit epsilon